MNRLGGRRMSMSLRLRAGALALAVAIGMWGGGVGRAQDELLEAPTDFDGDLRMPIVDPPPEGAPDARLKVFFDPVGKTRTRHAEAYLPFEFYIVAEGSHYGVVGWEALLTLDEGLEIVGEKLEGVRLGGPGEYIVGIRPDSCKVGASVILATVTAVVRGEGMNDLKIRLGPVEKPSVHDPPRAGYVICHPDKSLRPFVVDEISAVVNPREIQLDRPKQLDIFKPVKGRKDR